MFTRREMLTRTGMGMGLLGLAGLLPGRAAEPDAVSANPLAPKPPHFAGTARRIIHLFMNGGPSHIDTFDPKPALAAHAGRPLPANRRTERRTGAAFPSPFSFHRHGQSGLEVSELFPHTARCADDLAVIRSMQADVPNHEPSFLLMNCGDNRQSRPSLGAWLTYGLGTENQNLPGFVVMCPGGLPTVGAQNWRTAFLPGAFQGTYLDPKERDVERLIEHLRNDFQRPGRQRAQLDLLRILNERHRDLRFGDPDLDARLHSFELAYRMQLEATDAFDVGREFEVVTVSFEHKETPELAAAKKAAYLQRYKRPGAEAGWHFLVGDERQIARLTDAVGFRYAWDERTRQWAHPSGVVTLTPAGRISHYLFGIEYAPKDLRLSLVEAARGNIGGAVDQVLLYCYQYDPATGRYFLTPEQEFVLTQPESPAYIMGAFQIAGARTVIMSLWPVDDEAGRTFMTALYRRRFAEGRASFERSIRMTGHSTTRAAGQRRHASSRVQPSNATCGSAFSTIVSRMSPRGSLAAFLLMTPPPPARPPARLPPRPPPSPAPGSHHGFDTVHRRMESGPLRRH